VSVTDKVGGEEIRQDISALGDIIGRMGDYLTLMNGEGEQSSMTLRTILQMIAGVDKPLAGFKKIMKVLHVLGTSTKIESARLGQLGMGFYNLADDVENLAVQINDKSTRIMGENVSLSCKIRETLARMSDIEADQRDDVLLVLNKTRSSLDMITASTGIVPRLLRQSPRHPEGFPGISARSLPPCSFMTSPASSWSMCRRPSSNWGIAWQRLRLRKTACRAQLFPLKRWRARYTASAGCSPPTSCTHGTGW
jgi:hypothetical protein